MYKSTNGGESWKRLDLGIFVVNSILVDPSTPSLVYIGTPRGILKSTDGGETWRESLDLGDVPQIESLSPREVRPPTETYTGVDGTGFHLIVKGTGFLAGSTVYFNGAARPTSLSSCTRLMARIPSGDIAAPGSATITVVNPLPGGAASAPFPLVIHPPGLFREPPSRPPRTPRVLTRD